jgi:hypothetical protein
VPDHESTWYQYLEKGRAPSRANANAWRDDGRMSDEVMDTSAG